MLEERGSLWTCVLRQHAQEGGVVAAENGPEAAGVEGASQETPNSLLLMVQGCHAESTARILLKGVWLERSEA